MIRLLLASALAAVAVFVPVAGGSPSTTLTGVVTADASISLSNADGTRVTHLDPGSYVINVDDQTNLHNFHLSGPGVSQHTDLEGTGMVQWTVDFTNGTYKYFCDAHPLTMKGTFTVGPVGPGVPKLTAKVTARTISLKTAAGVRVRSLRQGSYRIAVSDTSKAQNFHLIGPGVNRKTGVAARANATWTVTLTPGTYVYRSDKSKKLHGTFTVTSVPPPGAP